MLQFGRRSLIGIGCWMLAVTCLAAGDAEVSFQKGKQLVAAGDLRSAVQALAGAVKLERANQQYLQQYLVTRQALTYESMLNKEQDPQRWEKAALALSSFYTSQGLPQHALPVDEAIFRRLKTSDAAIQLADTLLSLEQPDRAARVLTELSTEQVTSASQALFCVALVRQGKSDEARKVAAALQVGADADPGTLFVAARAQGAVGASEQAVALLVRCFEGVAPSRLELLKTHTRSCRDFSVMASNAAFAQALKTESKVPESKCSGGSSCSSCPMRGACAHGDAK